MALSWGFGRTMANIPQVVIGNKIDVEESKRVVSLYMASFAL